MKMRWTLLGLWLGLAMLLAVSVAPESALAQCCAPPPPPCCAPPPPCCAPPPSPPVATPCCNSGHNISIPSVNVNVASTVVVNAAASGVAVAGSRSGAGATVFYGGGGGGGGYAPPMASGLIQGLNVQGRQRAAYQASRTRTVRVVIQAVCIDDRQIPHPASQVRPDRDIDDVFDGELYRCIAGTRLQATIAEFSGKIDFSGGKTLACAKNDALYHAPGGKVECRTQKPARDCNERSLLRRFGAGIKVLTMVITESYTAYREEESSSVTSMSIDGGVGGIAY